MKEKVDLGQSFQFRCPPHTAGFGASYNWIQTERHGTQFLRDERRGISPDGTLFITYVTQEDIDDIEESQGIKCQMTAASSFRISGPLKLEKKNPQQTGKVGQKKQEIGRQFPGIEGTDIYPGVDLVTPIPIGPSRNAGDSNTQSTPPEKQLAKSLE